MEKFNGLTGVFEDFPFSSRPYPPFGRPCQMAEPVSSVAAVPSARSAPDGSTASATGRVAYAKACDARRPGRFPPSYCRPPTDCSGSLILRQPVQQHRRRR